MDPADLPGESDLTRALRLVDWVTHTSNARARVVGINAIEAILAGNPYLHQVRGFTDLISELHKAREAVQAREVADSAQQQRTTTVPKQPSQLHPPEVSRPDLSEVLPCPSEPSAVGKQRSRRRRFTLQPDSGTTVRPAVVSSKDAVASETVFSGAVHGESRDSTRCLPTFVVTDLSQVGIFKTSITVTDCVSSIPPPTPVSLQPVHQPLASSLAQPASIPLARSPAPSILEAVSAPPILNPVPGARFKRRDKHIKTTLVSQKLANLETGTRPRASPDAEFLPSVDSGPLEAKTPAKNCTVPALPGQSQCPAQFQLPVTLPAVPAPAGSVPSLPEVPAPAGSVPSLPEVSAPAGSVPSLPEVPAPAGSVLCVPGAPVPTGSETRGPEEPVQIPASSAGGPEEPVQPQDSSAGGPEEPVQPQDSSAGGSGEPSQIPASSAGGPEEPLEGPRSLSSLLPRQLEGPRSLLCLSFISSAWSSLCLSFISVAWSSFNILIIAWPGLSFAFAVTRPGLCLCFTLGFAWPGLCFSFTLGFAWPGLCFGFTLAVAWSCFSFTLAVAWSSLRVFVCSDAWSSLRVLILAWSSSGFILAGSSSGFILAGSSSGFVFAWSSFSLGFSLRLVWSRRGFSFRLVWSSLRLSFISSVWSSLRLSLGLACSRLLISLRFNCSTYITACSTYITACSTYITACNSPAAVRFRLCVFIHVWSSFCSALVWPGFCSALVWPGFCSALVWPCLVWPCGCHTVMRPSSSCSASPLPAVFQASKLTSWPSRTASGKSSSAPLASRPTSRPAQWSPLPSKWSAS
ncbi:uncharacterized protein LOC112847560 [Oreochromis niloticus]|uniref:uncharacterized protein LOC112847560 n=1 Tax=Oreochromis niloticus TaxID=8128 RepID=UPI000DF3152B|nr:uncharacterized protein LOC112847560 [Oreochromis niloticus]